MFEHLDDPQPFAASEGLRSAVVADGGRLRRRRRRRLVGSGALAVVLAATAGGWAYVDRRDAAIDRVEVATQPSTDGAVNILLLGDDAELAASSPEVIGSRVDAAVLVRIDDGGVRLLSIPRDLADPETGERFNESAAGDLGAAVAAVRSRLGDVAVDHVVRLDFAGFVALVDAVGGVPVRVARPIVDEPTGTELEPSEDCQVLDGATALGLVRARQVDGDPTGDLGRAARQRVLLQVALAQAEAGDVDALSRVVADHAVVSDGLDLATMVAVGRRLAGAGVVDASPLPVIATQRPDGAVVLELAAGAAEVVGSFGASDPRDGSTSVAGSGIAAIDPSVDPDLAPC